MARRRADDLGPVRRVHRMPSSWRCLWITAVVMVISVLARDPLLFVLLTAASIAPLLLARRVRVEVRTSGVVVQGFFRTRRWRWAEIDAFAPMRLSTGRPAGTAAVIVHGRPHEILAIRRPNLYAPLAILNAELATHRRARATRPSRPARPSRPIGVPPYGGVMRTGTYRPRDWSGAPTPSARPHASWN